VKRILLVEDNEQNRDMLSRRLRKKGYLVSEAIDGLQAIEMAGAEMPELILMDISLPELDGLEATRRIRADAKTGDIPIIALTAHALPTDREQALQAGCNDFDTKPVDMPRLLEKISTQLSEQ
jgi:CheY-like chemotaxis protein